MTDEPKELKKSDNLFDWLAKNYPNQPIIQALFAFVVGAASSATDSPLIGGLANTTIPLIVHGVGEILAERRRTLFDELAKGELHLTEEVVKKEEFLHNFFSIYNAAIRTSQREKIKMFARLLLTGIREDALGSTELEEFISILEDLSSRELEILLVLQKFQDLHPRQTKEVRGSLQPEDDFQLALRFWSLFEQEVVNKCEVQIDTLPSILTRLARTGLYEPINGFYAGYTGGKGLLTPTFAEFSRWIKIEADND